MVKATQTSDEQRRKDILDAALYCFLHFGFSKTSMEDVAKRAQLSRPLLYLKFKNKDDLLTSLFDHIMDGRVEESEKHLETDLPKKELLMKVCEVLVLEPWGRIAGYPMSEEFFNSCSMCDGKSTDKFDKNRIKIYAKILGDKAFGEVFHMALGGQLEDLPSPNVLRKRIEILVEKFSS